MKGQSVTGWPPPHVCQICQSEYGFGHSCPLLKRKRTGLTSELSFKELLEAHRPESMLLSDLSRFASVACVLERSVNSGPVLGIIDSVVDCHLVKNKVQASY